MRVALIGSGPPGEAYARALGQLAGVELVASCGVTSLAGRVGLNFPDAYSLLKEAPIEAVVFALGTGDPYPFLRRALLAGKHVLSAGPFILAARQTERLASQAQRAGRLLLFGEERLLSPSFAYLEQATAATDRSWRARYLRMLDIRARGRPGSSGVGTLAVENLAASLRLMRRTPRTVSAVGSQGAGGALSAAFINMVFAGGTVASVQVSVNEAAEVRQMVAALGSRTIVLDDLDRHLPLRVMAESVDSGAQAAGALPPAGGGVWQMGSLAFTNGPFDGPLAQARRFLDCLASPGQAQAKSNVNLWRRAAALWQAAEGSIALSGTPVPVEEWTAEGLGWPRYRAPHLRVIAGRASETKDASGGKRPALKLLSS